MAGFAIWGIDNVACSTLRSWRRELGLPWGLFLEGHAWWHIFTGFGSYCYIVWGIYLRHVLNGEQDEYELDWPQLWRLPEVVQVSNLSKRANGKAPNGGLKQR